MDTKMPAICLLIAWLSVPALAAQSQPPVDGPRACDLLTTAEVQQVTGRASQKPPDPLVEAKNQWSHCSYRDAKVHVALFSRASTAQKFADQEVVVGGLNDTRHAVAGVGDSAAIYYRAAGKAPRGLLVAFAGTRGLTVQVDMNRGQTSEAAQPYAVELAKLALAKLK